jgi:hypothetical protein
MWHDTADFSNAAATSVGVCGSSFKKTLRYSTSGTNSYNSSMYVTGYNANGILSGTVQRGAEGEEEMNASTIALRTTSNYPFKAGHTYHWVCGVME